MTEKRIALVMGDGAAPEMMRVACEIAIKAAERDGIRIIFEETPMGWNAYEKYGDTLPVSSRAKAIRLGTVFFGGVGDPILDNTLGKEHPEMRPETKCLLALRGGMGLLLNFRPMRYYKELDYLSGVRPERIPPEGINQVWIRFLLEDSYFGREHILHHLPETIVKEFGFKQKRDITGDEDEIAEPAYYSREMVEKYFRAVFAHAQKHGLPVTSIDKANMMSRYDFWRKIATRIGREFPDVPLTHLLVDSANALLFTPAKLHGDIACGNEHGDILSDGAAAAVGGMGMMHSSAVNPDDGNAMFESGAGTAPDLAGQDKANPLGRILTAAMMLEHIGAPNGARDIETTVYAVLSDGYRTGDIFSRNDDPTKLVGTAGMGGLVLAHL